MTNTDIFYTKLLPLLSAKNGPKILLFDPDTPLFFSNIIAHSTFLDLDFFLFDNITNKSRQKISQMVCYCLIRPSNLHLLINELKNPFYDSYIILFTNKLTEKQLIELADNDNKSIISEVYEIFTDCIFEDEMLYLVDKDAELGCNKIKRIVEGVSSICHTLETQPFIIYQNDSEVLKVLASEIIKNTEKLEKSSQLIIFDRKIDLYTPLIYNWTFQSMIYDKCKYENGIVSFTDKTYSIIQNEVFESLKFRDINSVGTELQNFTKRINEQKISTSIVDNIEEKVKRNETAESLLSIYNFLLSDCLKNKELSDIEHKIISENSIKVSELKKILKNNIFSFEYRLKLFLIFLMRNNINLNNLEAKNKIFERGISFEFSEFNEYINKFDKIFGKHLPSKIEYKKQIDCKLGFQPIIKKYVDDFIKNKLKSKKFISTSKNVKENKKIKFIVFINGITFCEYKEIIESIRARKKLFPDEKFVIIADRTIGWKDIFERLV